MVYINGVLINFNLWRCLMMCITLINGLVLINAYIGVNHRLQNLLMLNTVKLIMRGSSIDQYGNMNTEWRLKSTLVPDFESEISPILIHKGAVHNANQPDQ